MRFIAQGHEKIWPYPQRLKENGFFIAPKSVKIVGPVRADFIEDLAEILRVQIKQDATYSIILENGVVHDKQSYAIEISRDNTRIRGEDDAGLFYGMQTFIQAIAAYDPGIWPLLSITDWPDFQHRSFMVDMGRSVYSVAYLKRIVKILARLRMNQLHLHLFDDELCGIRFEGLPFGNENPYSINIADLAELVEYAIGYHVQIVPELETWGHVGSIVYHDSQLRGGDGMCGGSSLLIGERAFNLVGKMIEQVVSVMPADSIIHLGLDEALWFKDNSVPDDYCPKDMVRRYYEILMDAAKSQNKKVKMLIWADHGGREIPQEIKHGVIVQPWMYWRSQCKVIDKYIDQYSSVDNPKWMIGAGQSMAHYRGTYQATRYWCRKAKNSRNVYGLNITFWGWNDLDDKFSTLFFGAYYAWNACAPTFFSEIDETEDFERVAYPIMFWWQSIFSEADPDGMRLDRGSVVLNGFYLWGKLHGKAVSPTVLSAKTSLGHDYLNEHSKSLPKRI